MSPAVTQLHPEAETIFKDRLPQRLGSRALRDAGHASKVSARDIEVGSTWC